MVGQQPCRLRPPLKSMREALETCGGCCLGELGSNYLKQTTLSQHTLVPVEPKRMRTYFVWFLDHYALSLISSRNDEVIPCFKFFVTLAVLWGNHCFLNNTCTKFNGYLQLGLSWRSFQHSSFAHLPNYFSADVVLHLFCQEPASLRHQLSRVKS